MIHSIQSKPDPSFCHREKSNKQELQSQNTANSLKNSLEIEPQQKSQLSLQSTTSSNSSQGSGLQKNLVKSRSSRELRQTQSQISENSAGITSEFKEIRANFNLKRFHSSAKHTIETLAHRSPCQKQKNVSFFNSKIKQLEKLNTKLTLLKQEMVSSSQFEVIQKKSYYIKDLQRDLENIDREQELIHLNHFKKNFHTLEKFNNFKGTRSITSNYHQILRSPFQKPKGTPTLILNLDESLFLVEQTEKPFVQNLIYLPCKQTSKNHKYELKLRPYLTKFLEESSKTFEIILFTSKSHEFTKQILGYLDPRKRLISKILDEDYTFCKKGQNENSLRDLSKINCDLKRTVYVSSNICSYALQPKNGIPIVPYDGSKEDVELLKLLEYLKQLGGEENIALKNDEHLMQSRYNYFFNKNMPSSLITKALYEKN